MNSLYNADKEAKRTFDCFEDELLTLALYWIHHSTSTQEMIDYHLYIVMGFWETRYLAGHGSITIGD
jgi:hypothetical protein